MEAMSEWLLEHGMGEVDGSGRGFGELEHVGTVSEQFGDEDRLHDIDDVAVNHRGTLNRVRFHIFHSIIFYFHICKTLQACFKVRSLLMHLSDKINQSATEKQHKQIPKRTVFGPCYFGSVALFDPCWPLPPRRWPARRRPRTSPCGRPMRRMGGFLPVGRQPWAALRVCWAQ